MNFKVWLTLLLFWKEEEFEENDDTYDDVASVLERGY